MKPHIIKHSLSSPQQQRGAALLILLTLVVLAAGYTLLKRLNQTPSDLSRAGDTAAVLGEAKAALIGYALKPQTRPGELPCPDSYNPGSNKSGDQTPGCTGNTFRLPWRTLGLPDLRDSSGERLWYAVDPAFTSAGLTINSNTSAVQTIDGGTTGYAAVIIAPGKSLQGQTRSGGQQTNILRYLEADNANNDAFFVTATNGNFNDQVIGITRDELMQAVERRVLKEVSNKLNDYYAANTYFPTPALLGTPPPGIPVCEISAGMVPLNITTACTSQNPWGAAALPTWFQNNNWDQTIWYVVSDDCDQSATNTCVGVLANPLTVNDIPNTNNNVQALLIAGGAALPGLSQNRTPVTSDNDLLDSNENRGDDAVFEILPIDATSNDQIQVVAP